MTKNELLELLVADENTTLEDFRRIFADYKEKTSDVLTEYEIRVSDLENDVLSRDTKISELETEIERLRTENGRLFRERIATYHNDVNNEDEEELEKMIKEIEF